MDLKTHEIYFEGKKQVVEEVEKSNIMNQESVVFKKIIWLQKKTFCIGLQFYLCRVRGYLLGESKPLAIQRWDTPTGQGQMECAFNLKTAGRPEL